MFELSVALKYLIPKWRQLSVSIISLISICVIALVVWLITVFFSVTTGLETGWIQKLIALTAPARIYPTEEYYDSYYYLADSISEQSNYTLKSIGEKLASFSSDPYNADFDQEVPSHWAKPDLDANGQLIDPVKLAFEKIKGIRGVSGLSASEYEMTVANIKLKQIRGNPATLTLTGQPESDSSQSTISQATYLGSYDPDNPNLVKAMLPVSKEDVQNLLDMAWVDTDFHINSEDEFQEEGQSAMVLPGGSDQLRAAEKLKAIFKSIHISSLTTKREGLSVSTGFLRDGCRLDVCALKIGKKVKTIFIPQDSESLEAYMSRPFNERILATAATLTKQSGKAYLKFQDGTEVEVDENTPVAIDKGITFKARIDPSSLELAKSMQEIQIDAIMNVQGEPLTGKVPWDKLEIASFAIDDSHSNPFWIFNNSIPLSLPSDARIGDAILLPKSYRSAGVLLGDRGYLSYQTATVSAVQEQRVPIYVAGFYDPGILPLGGKIVLANQYITSMIRSSYPNDQSALSNGINVRFKNLGDAESVKNQIEKGFKDAGIDKYWKVETYREFEFTKDFLQQLRSERNLFSLISVIIIIVACSNIVSMLIILVNNKKLEIGILRAMGASSKSIALIFGTCGMVMGLAGSLIGLAAALFTLRYLQTLIDLISRLQGFDMFNPVFYGDSLPNQVSFEALAFVTGATALISLIAGVVPAVKACLMKPSSILRSE